MQFFEQDYFLNRRDLKMDGLLPQIPKHDLLLRVPGSGVSASETRGHWGLLAITSLGHNLRAISL